MMPVFPFLSVTIFLPLAGALLMALFIRGDSETAAQNARHTALWTSLVTLAAAGALWYLFDPSDSGFQFVEHRPWLERYGIAYYLGIDGISLFLVLLTALLTPICILASWRSITVRVKEYMIAFLVLETFVIGVFCVLDLLMFYIFFEGMLIPMYLIIGVWGGERRVYAAYKFFLYTLAGSVLFLVALLYIYGTFGTMSIPELTQLAPKFTPAVQGWLWLALFASFAVKIPMWPVHTWLPDAHVEAPTAGSVILAGILLKMGGYGFLRFSLPMLPHASMEFAPFVFTLSIIAVVYTSLVALVQEDMKKLIAYSSIAHMGYVTAGIFTLNPQGVEGAMIQMLSHGLVSGALFLCVGVVYDRMHTREIAAYGGLVQRMPRYAVLFMLFTMASVGLPGTSGFVGEFLVLLGSYRVAPWLALGLGTGLILGAAYALWLYRRVLFGALTRTELKQIPDITAREGWLFVPLAALVLWMGIYPAPFLDVLHPAVEHLLQGMGAHMPSNVMIVETH